MSTNIIIPTFDVTWEFPYAGRTIKKTQKDFDNEYFPSGHQIYDTKFYDDIKIERKVITKDPSTGKTSESISYDTHFVKRVSVSYQYDAVNIILPHLLGNKIRFSNISLGSAEAESSDIFNNYCTVANNKNYDTKWAEFTKATLIWGHAATYNYSDANGKTQCRVLSYGNGDDLRCQYDIYGKPEKLFRKYSPVIINDDGVEEKINLVDVIDITGIKTYNEDGSKYANAEDQINVSNVLPFNYHKRKYGAFWSFAQDNINHLEKLLSLFSEDNVSKSKAKYVITGAKSSKSGDKNHQIIKAGDMDVFVGTGDADMKMLQGASLSESFKFEYETLQENIFNTMGIVYPKQKSSGDMPTGAMKMVFFPTERKCMNLINEYNPVLDNFNSIQKAFYAIEYQDQNFDTLDISASIQLYTPQDEYTKAQIFEIGQRTVSISDETRQKEFPFAEQNNAQMIAKEQAMKEEKARREAERLAKQSKVTSEEIIVDKE